MALVRTDNLSRVYGRDGIRVTALDSVSIEIEKGAFTALVGPSGSGKTTLLNLIGGLDAPDSGKVFIDGVDITSLPASALSDLRLSKIGFVFQELNLIPVLSVMENVEYVMLLKGMAPDERRKKAMEALCAVGLADRAKSRPSELSGGQQQRVAVARAIVSKPSIVLADEPTANLDSKTGASLIDMMRGLNEDMGVTFIFSTHDRNIMDHAKQIVELCDGRVSGRGATQE